MFNKNLLIGIALSFSLSACGGSTPPTGADTSSLSSMSSSITPLTGSSDSGITPVGSINPGDAYDQTANVPTTDAAPADTDAPEAAAEAEADTAASATDTGATTASPATGTIPADTTVSEPYNPTTSSGSTSTTAAAVSYSTDGSYKVDQDTFNQWQAANISTDGTNIYVAAVDTKSPAKGTVITMDGSGGSWKDIGKSLLATFSFGALGYKMNKTITGVTLDSSGNVLVTDASDRVYKMAAPKFGITEVKLSLSGATDVTAAGSDYYVATASGIQKIDGGVSSVSSFGSVTPTGGLGADTQGNLYAVVGSTIKKFNATGTATDVVKNVSGGLDVAVDSKGNIFVLGMSSVTWYNAKGVKQGEFGTSDLVAPKALCIDSSDSVFVADAGTDYKTSVVVKFSPSSGGSGSLGESLGSLDQL